jgi:YaiO family outer membrane protein
MLLVAGGLAAAAEQDPDALFAQALTLQKSHRDQAKALCRQALEGSPDYHDIRIQLARMEAWDGRYGDARREIGYVLERKPANLEAREVAIDIEVWADQPREALRICDAGLALEPREPVLHYRRARLLKSLGDLEGAMAAVRKALAGDPNDQPARLLRDDLKELLQRNKVGLDFTYDTFNKVFEPWRQVALALGHRFDTGSVIATVNRGHLFGTWGSQYQLDAYPHIAEGTYAYLNVGHSDATIFPSFNAGAELYHNFPHGIEASLGLRYLDFRGSCVTMYTGSIGKYAGNALYTFRSYVTPSATGTSYSGSLAGRFYLEDADNYLDLSAGTGLSPNYFAWSAASVTMHSRNAAVLLQRKLARAWFGSVKLGWTDQEIQPGTYQTDWTCNLHLDYRF